MDAVRRLLSHEIDEVENAGTRLRIHSINLSDKVLAFSAWKEDFSAVCYKELKITDLRVSIHQDNASSVGARTSGPASPTKQLKVIQLSPTASLVPRVHLRCRGLGVQSGDQV